MNFNHNFSLTSSLSELSKSLVIENETRPAYGMCAASPDDQLTPADYFYSLMDAINQSNTPASPPKRLRKKFKEMSPATAIDHQAYTAYRQKKQELLKELETWVSASQAIESATPSKTTLETLVPLNEIKKPPDLDANKWDNTHIAIYNKIKDAWNQDKDKYLQIIQSGKDSKKILGEVKTALYKDINDTNTLYNPIFVAIYTQITETVLTWAKNQTNSLNNAYEETLHALSSNPARASLPELGLIKDLLREQKAHSIERFFNLPKHYSNFLRHIGILDKKLKEFYPKDPLSTKDRLVQNLVISIIEGSWFEEEAGKTGKSTVLANHHDHTIMGCETKGHYSDNAKQAAVEKLNSLLHIKEKRFEVKEFNRSHTQPFPALFTWNLDVLKREIFDQHGISIAPNCRYETTGLSKSFFKHPLRLEDPAFLDKALENALASASKGRSAAEFLYAAFVILKQYHLSVFSETEYLPDFMNQTIDKLSEFDISKWNNNYKLCLATALIQLLEQPNLSTVSEKEIAYQLTYYMEQTNTAVNRKIEEWEKTPSLITTVYRICALQHGQAMNQAFKAFKLS